MDYEQALVAFNAALAIEPKNVDAYLSIVEVYIRTNEFELALETAKEGYEVTGDEHLKEKIDMIESGDIFASNGWMMKMCFYDGDGNLLSWHEYTYNIKGQEASVAKYSAQGVQEQYLELAYDEEGRTLIVYFYDWGGNLNKLVREYDGNNYRETYYEGTSDKIRGDYQDVEVDSDGFIRKQTLYNEDGSVERITVYEYDEEGKPLQYQNYDGNNVLIDYSERVYDEEGNCLGERLYDADGNFRSEVVYQ